MSIYVYVGSLGPVALHDWTHDANRHASYSMNGFTRVLRSGISGTCNTDMHVILAETWTVQDGRNSPILHACLLQDPASLASTSLGNAKSASPGKVPWLENK